MLQGDTNVGTGTPGYSKHSGCEGSHDRRDDFGEGSSQRDFFRPRRLGHANLFVSDYVEAQKFYYSVAGIHEAYRQPDNMASFITNGNTYHDFGLTDIHSPYAPKGQKPRTVPSGL